MAGSPIHLLVLATTEVQSKDTLFANIKGRLEQAPYFQGLRQQGKLIINTLDIQYPSKNITIWAGHSNCVSGATLIATTEGLRRADELVPTSSVEQTFPVRFSVPTLDGPKSVNTGICVGKQKTLKIRTRWGYEVEGSIRHPVMVMGPDGRTTWKRLPDIEPGDFVAVKRGWEGPPQLSLTEFSYNYKPGSSGTNAFVPPGYMNPDLARFLGYLIGDGCVTIKDRVGFKSMDYELVEDFAYLCKHLFNTELQLGTTQEDNKSQMYWAYNVKLKAYLEWLGMSSVKAPDKTIPWSIARADNESIANFLKALFDTDGYAATTNKLVGFTTTSEELAKQVQLLLLQLGIVSDRYKGSEPAGVRYWKGKCINSQHASFQVVMRGPEVDRYMSCIGFTASRKALAIPQRNHKVVCDVIPYVHKVLQNLRTLEIAGRVERPTKERIADWQLIRKTIGNTHAPGRPDHGGTSLLKLQRAIKYFQSTKNAEEDICYLESLADGQLFFDPVEHISEGTAYLYDFEVPEAHHFFSNGIVSHNSSGLVGRTLMVFAMDEANRFGIEGASGQSGVDLYANVGKGTLTLSRFGSKKIVISSAWCEGDLTDRLFGNAEGEASHILAFRLATWDMNPEFAILKEEHPSIKAEYMTRGVEAMRDYAGVRPGSEENFFHKHALARASKYPLQVDYIPKISVQQGPDGPRKFSSIEVVAPPEVVKGAMFSFGHCDPGLKHDSFGFLAAHPVVDPLTGNVIVQVNSVLEWRPVDKGRGDIYLVDYENVCDEIIKLSKSIHLKKLTFDHWNSAMMIQRIYSAGISTELWKSSFSQTEQRKIYQVLREWIDQDRVRIPPPDQSPAAAKLHKELSELKLMNGRRIDHPKPKGSKDLSDCLACVVYRISQDERRFRYFETGTNNIRSSGEIHTARAITDLFAEERQLADRAKLIDPRRSNNPNSSSIRNTRISQKDW